MTIKELLAEDQFDAIVFYLNEHGYTSPLDLSEFDFDELFFVPGVSDDALNRCKEILLEYAANHDNESEQALQGAATYHENVSIPPTVSDDISAYEDITSAFFDLMECIATAIEVVGSRDRIDLFRAAFLDQPNCCASFDYDLFSLLCDEIDALIPGAEVEISKEETSVVAHSPDEPWKTELLSAVTVEDVFAGIPRGSAMIRFCRENDIETLLDLGSIDFSEIKVKGLGPSSIRNCEEVYLARYNAVLEGELNIPVPKSSSQQWFVKTFTNMPERERTCLIARVQGMTLQAVGELYGITRERVRQIISKAIRRLRAQCGAVFNTLSTDQQSIYTQDLKTAFIEQDQIDVIAYILKDSNSICFFPFSDKFVRSRYVPEDWNSRLRQITKDIIGDAINYYENLDIIDDRLASEGLGFLNSLDYMGYLLEHGYKAFGDYLIKGAQAYRNTCLDVIRRHFPGGIKLDNDDNNSDLELLRSIVLKEFGKVELPNNNRALTARIAPALILCGRGRYISPENVVIDVELIEEIVNYINESPETTLYYSEVFSVFSGRLLAETGIDNTNYLHGVLKFFYPDEFKYERDLLVKKGKNRVPFEDRLAQLIRDNHQPMSKEEIQEKLLGVTDIRIVNAMARQPKIIQWDYNKYNHMDNLSISQKEILQINSVLKELTDKQSGYCSENGLFEAVMQEMPEFVHKNSIENSHNLFYIASFFFGESYRFSRPHIASAAFPNIDLTNTNLARFFIGQSKRLLYPDLVELSRRTGWSSGTFSVVLNAVEKDYCKISLNEYISKNIFYIEEDALLLIQRAVSNLVSDSGYYGIFAIYDYSAFPDVPYEWNEFLLQTVLEMYDLGFRVLEPSFRDRRYKRGIIVPDSCSCESYESFVIEQMKKDRIHSIPEDEFSSYLRRKGLVLTANIPQELYDGDGVRLENGVFVY